MSEPDIIGTPDIEMRPERINLRAGTIIRTVGSSGSKTWPVDPPFIVPDDGYYRAIVDTAKGTATMERVHPPNRWAAFTDDELYLIHERVVINRRIASKQPQYESEMLDQLEAEIRTRHAEIARRTAGSPPLE